MNDSSKWDGEYYLAADIDLSSMTNQAPIGNNTDNFTGVFDGNGKTISGLNISGLKYQALFGYAKDATIKNLTVKGKVEENSISGSEVYAGGIVGALTGKSTLENVKSYVDVSSLLVGSAQAVGGLVGKAGCTSTDASNPDVINILNCHSYGTVEAGRGTGNLIGIVAADGVEGSVTAVGGKINIVDCTANGTVIYYSASDFGQCGGLFGCIYGQKAYDFEINVTNCTNNASVSGATPKSRIGGIVGWLNCETDNSANPSGGTVNFINCKNYGEIKASAYCGGIIGYCPVLRRTDVIVNVQNCVNYGSISTSAYAAGGLLGGAVGGTFNFKNSANYGDLTAGSHTVGGIFAYAKKHANAAVFEFNITDCANYGALSGTTDIGGLAGMSDGKITAVRFFNGGTLTSTDLAGLKSGLAANVTDITATDSFFLNSETDTAGKAIAAADAAKAATFTSWDFANTWVIENGLPVLKFLSTATVPETTAAPTTAASTTAASTTAAQTTASGAQTTAPSTGESSQTSDILWIVSAMALMAVFAAILIARSRREEN